MENRVIWKCPSPSSGFFNDVALTILSKRECRLVFQYENELDREMKTINLSFINTVAFRCTYLPALTVEMVDTSYDQLIDVGISDWLKSAAEAMKGRRFDFNIRHLKITLDDGPCYEFLCEGFQTRGE